MGKLMKTSEELMRCTSILKEQGDWLVKLTDKVDVYAFAYEYVLDKLVGDNKEERDKITDEALKYAENELTEQKKRLYAQVGGAKKNEQG